uniref:Uncharacterized protein n=1 Tax=Oryza punctata TaxID=4537 RepID=A0A0E0KIH9_ORYPU
MSTYPPWPNKGPLLGSGEGTIPMCRLNPARAAPPRRLVIPLVLRRGGGAAIADAARATGGGRVARLAEPVEAAVVDEVAVHVEGGGVGRVVAVHHHELHLVGGLPVPLPLVDEPIVDLLQVQPRRLGQRHLLTLLLNT